MRFYLLLSTVAVAGALAGAVRAQTETCDLKAGPPSPDFERYAATQWPKEAERFKANGQNVSRQGNRLRLRLENGTVELVDCPRGDEAHVFLYEDYDDKGGFYVVRRPAFRDFSYVLVMRATGKQYTVYGTPIWAQDRSHFVTVACTWLPTRGALTIRAPAKGELRTETQVPLPTCLDQTESCSARWDNPSWIAVTCTRTDGSTRKGSEFVVLKGSDGVWKTFGR
ncbi:MAG TPA: hypothetical protein VMI56_24925 [Reyranella sp.]|nr:hypothetical protein [Reyranella sp.]